MNSPEQKPRLQCRRTTNLRVELSYLPSTHSNSFKIHLPTQTVLLLLFIFIITAAAYDRYKFKLISRYDKQKPQSLFVHPIKYIIIDIFVKEVFV